MFARKILQRRLFSTGSSINNNMLEGLQKRNALALTTWFCSPDLGMKDYEVLIRSSAFVVKSNLSEGPGYHIVTSSHNLAPWRFPKYYSDPFLEYVNEGHIHYTLEVRNSQGESVSSIDILPNSFHHRNRDIGIVHFDKDESKVLSVFKNLMYKKLDIENYTASDQEQVEFHGHEVSDADVDMDVDTLEGKDLRLSLPRSYTGEVFGRSSHQTFCSTTEGVLPQGMCGGPVVGSRGSICGMVEGIVPEDHPQESLRGKAVIIDSVDILQFIEGVESFVAGEERDDIVHLKGGEIAYETIGVEAVAEKDKYEDPFENIMKNT